MEKKIIYLLMVQLIISVFFFSDYVMADNSQEKLDFYIQSDKQIKGSFNLQGQKESASTTNQESYMSFNSVLQSDGNIETSIEIGKQQITIEFDEINNELSILGVDICTSNTILINENKSNLLKKLLTHLLKKQDNFGDDNIEKTFLRTLNLMHSWPSNLPVFYNTQLFNDISALKQQNNNYTTNEISRRAISCFIGNFSNGYKNICNEIGYTKVGAYPTDGESCIEYGGIMVSIILKLYPLPAKIIRNILGYINKLTNVSLSRPTSWEDADSLVGGDNCFGRCGKGCIGDGLPNNSVDVYTQECFEHDLCVEKTGKYTDPKCNWLFLFTIDDFISGYLGNNCSTSKQLT